MTPDVHIWTDGSAWQGRGGCGVIIVGRRSKLIIAQPLRPVVGYPITNQIAELAAAVIALKALRGRVRARLFSDSEYLVKAFTHGWLAKWQDRAVGGKWRTVQGDPIANQLWWEQLERLSAGHDVHWQHMRGHGKGGSDVDPRWVEYNARCDRLATAARKGELCIEKKVRLR